MTIPDSLLEAARDAYDNHDAAFDACEPEALRAALEAVAGRLAPRPRLIQTANELRRLGELVSRVDRQAVLRGPWGPLWVVREGDATDRVMVKRLEEHASGWVSWVSSETTDDDVNTWGPWLVLDGPKDVSGL